MQGLPAVVLHDAHNHGAEVSERLQAAALCCRLVHALVPSRVSRPQDCKLTRGLPPRKISNLISLLKGAHTVCLTYLAWLCLKG